MISRGEITTASAILGSATATRSISLSNRSSSPRPVMIAISRGLCASAGAIDGSRGDAQQQLSEWCQRLSFEGFLHVFVSPEDIDHQPRFFGLLLSVLGSFELGIVLDLLLAGQFLPDLGSSRLGAFPRRLVVRPCRALASRALIIGSSTSVLTGRKVRIGGILRVAQRQADFALILGQFQLLRVLGDICSVATGILVAFGSGSGPPPRRPMASTRMFCRIVEVTASAMEPGRVNRTSTREPGWIRPATPLNR